MYCIIIQVNPGYTHLDLDLVFYNLPCIISITIHFTTYVLPLIHLPPPPLCSPLQINAKRLYPVQSNHCSKQYIGETKRRLQDHFNEHCRPVDNPSNISQPTTVSEHFLTNDHSANDITLIPLELIKSNHKLIMG